MSSKDGSYRVAGVPPPRLADKQSTSLVTDLGSLIVTARSSEPSPSRARVDTSGCWSSSMKDNVANEVRDDVYL